MPSRRTLPTLAILTVAGWLPYSACGGKVEPQPGTGSGVGTSSQGTLQPGTTTPGTGVPAGTTSTQPTPTSTGAPTTTTPSPVFDAQAPVSCTAGGGSGGGGGGPDAGCFSTSEFADCSNGTLEVDCSCPAGTCECTINSRVVATLPIFDCASCTTTSDAWMACGFPPQI